MNALCINREHDLNVESEAYNAQSYFLVWLSGPTFMATPQNEGESLECSSL
jgi:hypothetical protein